MERLMSSDAVPAFYHRDDIVAALRAALDRSGRTMAGLHAEDFAGFDQFHLRGLAATLDLLQLAQARHGERMLDLGGGLGGSARVAASRAACHVTVVDATPAFCEAGEEITRWLRLEDRVHFLVGDATAPPVPDASFDVVWTQHASMNIPDKAALYHAAARALVPGGRFVLHDVMGDDGMEGLHYPLPWADSSELNALLHVDAQRQLIREAGFTERAWHDVTEQTLEWLVRRREPPPASPLGPNLLFGDDATRMFDNLRRNIDERRIRVIQAAFD
jgi:SAM-dependent methyltransferase